MKEKKSEITELTQKLGEMQEKYQRSLADFANFQKQAEIQKENAKKVGAETTILKLLPLIDDLSRAIEATPELEPIKKTLEKSLKDLKLEKINSKKGTAFNPDLHDAISMDDSNDGDFEVIAEELRPGYIYEGSIIRPAMVKVEKTDKPAELEPKSGSESDIISTSEKLELIRNWLGSGSINIFGLPMSGKDTVGNRLAESLSAVFLSSGDIIRRHEAETGIDFTGNGQLAPTDVFYEVVLPYFSSPELNNKPLILSSIGRWDGEENEIMSATKNGNHEIKAVIELKLTEDEAKNRWETAKKLQDRGVRADDSSPEIFEKRLSEFRDKTRPVLEHYNKLGLLIPVDATVSREEVFKNVVDSIYNFIKGGENA